MNLVRQYPPCDATHLHKLSFSLVVFDYLSFTLILSYFLRAGPCEESVGDAEDCFADVGCDARDAATC